MTIGEKIKHLRVSHELSQADVAKAINSTKQAIYKYENGIVTNIPLDKVEAMARLFGVTPSYLMGWAECEPQKTPEKSRIDVLFSRLDEIDKVKAVSFIEGLLASDKYADGASISDDIAATLSTVAEKKMPIK